MAGSLVLVVMNLAWAADKGASVLALLAVAAGLAAGVFLILRANDSRTAANPPDGVLHAVNGSVLLGDVRSDHRLRAALIDLRRPWANMGVGRLPGRLEVTDEDLRWIPGRMAQRSRMPGFEIPLRSVAKVEVVSSFFFPVDYAGLEVFGVDGGRLSIETRGADRLRRTLARTTLADAGRRIEPELEIVWRPTVDVPGIPLGPRARVGLLAGGAVAMAFVFGVIAASTL